MSETIEEMMESEPLSALIKRPVAPLLELGAYEALWDTPTASFKSIADIFRKRPDSIPSDFIPHDIALKYATEVMEVFGQSKIENFGLRIHGAGEYPQKLRDARDPVELLYFRGWWDLINRPKSVAVVGTRNISEEGIRRTKKLVKLLVKHDFTIVSGLARGVDTAAHTTAIEEGGLTIAVIGTPLTEIYPKENFELQELISKSFLLISQVPVIRYGKQDYRKNRLFFPERNKTMSAITDATIIVEAGETSGTLIQAQAAFEQGRKLFILDSCFNRKDITWPARFAERGAVRVRDFDDILNILG